jgi:hypothetical protein
MSNPDNSQKEFRPTLEQFEEIIREADAIISRSSPQISQPSQPSQPSLTFDQYEADRENEPLTDNTSSLPVALSLGSTSQGQPSLTPQATHDPDIYFDLIKRTKPSQNATQTSYQLTQESNSTSGPSNVSSSTQPPTPNSQCLLVPMPGRFPNTTSFIEFPDPAMQELPPIPSTWSQTPFTQGAPTLQTMPSQQPYPALPSSMSIPATPLANGVILNDCFYSYSDLAAVLQPQPGLPGNSTWQGGNNNAG